MIVKVRAFGFGSSKIGLFSKVPKSVGIEKPKSWLHSLFSSSENTVSYMLLKQLFGYLQSTDILRNQFPYLSNNERFEENWMIVHVYLLRSRMKREQDLPKSEHLKFQYNLQTYFFPDFAQFVNTAIPVHNFRAHYSEAYMNKYEAFEEILNEFEWESGPNQQLAAQKYGGVLRKVIYENRVNLENMELLKLCKYYSAHKKYLQMLEWQDMLDHKVKWGFESLKLISQIDK